jgi:hypothetical protein
MSDEKGIGAVCKRLVDEANAKTAFLVDRKGRVLASAGVLTDFTSSLAAFAASKTELHKLITGEEPSLTLRMRGEDGLHISLVAKTAILVVAFDLHSAPDLERQVMDAHAELEAALLSLPGTSGPDGTPPPASGGDGGSGAPAELGLPSWKH